MRHGYAHPLVRKAFTRSLVPYTTGPPLTTPQDLRRCRLSTLSTTVTTDDLNEYGYEGNDARLSNARFLGTNATLAPASPTDTPTRQDRH